MIGAVITSFARGWFPYVGIFPQILRWLMWVLNAKAAMDIAPMKLSTLGLQFGAGWLVFLRAVLQS